MWLGLNIFAYDNVFNRHTTEGCSYYWSNMNDLGVLIQKTKKNKILNNCYNMKQIAQNKYNWKIICEKYLKVINS